MGASSSKAAASAASAAARSTSRRVYPSRSPGAAPTSHATPGGSQSTSATTPMSAAASAPSTGAGAQGQPQTQVSETRTQAIDIDARDPDFASRLSQLGPVRHPAPTFSPSSTASRQSESPAVDRHITPSSSYPSGPSSGPSSGGIFPDPARNPAIAMLKARQQIADAVEAEKQAQGRKGWQGRKYADVATLRKALVLRDEQGMPESEVEQVLGLRKGSVAALGGIGTVEAV